MSRVVHSPSEIETGIFSSDQVDDRLVAEEAVAEVEAQIVPDHHAGSARRRLVEAVLPFELLDERGVEALARRGSGSPSPRRRPAGRPWAAARRRRRSPGRGPPARWPWIREIIFSHRPAGRRLDDDEVDHHDAEQRRQDQQEPAESIGQHRAGPSTPPWRSRRRASSPGAARPRRVHPPRRVRLRAGGRAGPDRGLPNSSHCADPGHVGVPVGITKWCKTENPGRGRGRRPPSPRASTRHTLPIRASTAGP